MKRLFQLTVILFLCALAPLHADEQTSTYRIFGLFSPDRQNDLREILNAVPDVQIAGLDYDKGEVTLHYDVAKLFPESKGKTPPPAEKITARISDLISDPARRTFSVSAPSALPADKLTALEIKVGILDCKGCRYVAYSAIAKIEGVERATVTSHGNVGTITAAIDATKTNLEALTAALKKANVPFPAK